MQNLIPTSYLKAAVLVLMTFFGTTMACSASELTWHTDMKKAQQIAAKKEKHVLINFTGSDWCPWCVKLDANVFSTSEFAEFAAKELVLVKIDFPRKEQLNQEQAAANERLAKRYRVRGFPTLIILNSQGERLGSTGFRQESANNYIEHLQGMME